MHSAPGLTMQRSGTIFVLVSLIVSAIPPLSAQTAAFAGNTFPGPRWIAASDSPDAATPALRDAGAVDKAPIATPGPLPIFRRTFTASSKPSRAILTISGLGHFEAHINGKNVTSNVLTPGWSDYTKRVYYDTFDVTALVVPGPNAIGVLLGNGMYNPQHVRGRYTKWVGSFGQPRLIAALRLEYPDGRSEKILSDSSWTWTQGPITFSSIYGGEDFDAGRVHAGWDTAAFTPSEAWLPATVVSGPGGKLVPETIPPVVQNETYTPIAITHPRPGIAVYDLGQNFAGWPEITVSGPPGASVKMTPGELLDSNGLVTQRSGGAGPNDPVLYTYTLAGTAAPETWHPSFSYTGFRYIQVELSPAAANGALPVIASLTGRFLHAAVTVDGHFTSSSDLLNRIHLLIDRAILSNTVSVLTDCPQREKLGWLEQTHLAATSLMYNYNLDRLYTKMAADMRDAQTSTGLVPDIAPEYPVFSGRFRDSPEWGVADILSPWAAYQFYGDLSLLRDQYASMQRYAAYLQGKAENHILTYGLGDWYDIGPGRPGVSQLTAPGLTPTAIYYQSLVTLAQIATLLHHPADASAYTREAAEVKSAFNAKFFHPGTSQYDKGSQTANAMPLVTGLVPEDHRAAVLANLVADIHAHLDHVTAGDIGFHYLVRALTDGGRSDVLYAMLSRTDAPSYGDQLAHGATTLTEAWNADPSSSQNHFMLGHAEEWFYRGLAGIDFDLSRPAGQQIRIAPAVVGDLTQVTATFHSKLGPIASAWTRSGDTLHMTLTLPATAQVLFPPGFHGSITLNGKPLTPGGPVLRSNLTGPTPQASLRAGTYTFELDK